MRTLGVVGGTGPESTIEYYRRLIEGFRRRWPDAGAPTIVVFSIDGVRLLDLLHRNELGEAGDVLVTAVDRLAAAGAQAAVLTSASVHSMFSHIEAAAALPLISMLSAARDAVRDRNLRRVLLLATRFTAAGAWFHAPFADTGITLILPDQTDQDFIHDRYVTELVAGRIVDSTRDRVLQIVERTREQKGVEGVLLGGTELSLLIPHPVIAGMPVLDVTQIHVDAALAWLDPMRPDP